MNRQSSSPAGSPTMMSSSPNRSQTSTNFHHHNQQQQQQLPSGVLGGGSSSSPTAGGSPLTSPNFHNSPPGGMTKRQHRASMANARTAQLDEKSLTEKLLSHVSASELAFLDPNFTAGLAEAMVVIRRRKKSASKVIKGTMQHLTGTDVSDYDDHYYLLRVWAPENDPGGAILFLLRIQRPDTGELFVSGVELVIPVRGVVGVGAHSISDGDPVKHFKINHANTSTVSGRARVQASFVQGQVALDIKIDPATVDQQMKKKNVTRITGTKKAAELKDGKLILCFESMEERNIWLDFLTNLLMDVETADLRLEELNRRRRNRTIGPSGTMTETSLLASIENAKMPPPPNPTGITPDDITRYRMHHFKGDASSGMNGNNNNNNNNNQGLGNVVVGPSQSLQSPPGNGELLVKLKGEEAPVKRKVFAKNHGSILIQFSAVSSQEIDLTNSLIQATSPYSEPFHVIKVPFDAATAAEELQNGGPVKLLDCRAKNPEERQKWIEWMIFVKGIPQSEDDTFTYREVEKKVALEKKKDENDNNLEQQADASIVLKKSTSNLHRGHLSASNLFSNNNKDSLKSALSDRSSQHSVGSHVFSKNKQLNKPKVHDAWREFTFGHEEEVVIDPRQMKDLLYDTSIDWSLPRNMLPMPAEFSPEEQLKMSRKKEEIRQQQRVDQLRAIQQAEMKQEEMRQTQAQNDENLYQYSDNVIENEHSLDFGRYDSSPISSTNNNRDRRMSYDNNNSHSQQRHYDHLVEQQQQLASSGSSSWTQQMAMMLHGSSGSSPHHQQSSRNTNSSLSSSGTDFVTKGCWAYVQLNAQGMPPMVDEAAFSLRYFFACFGGCVPDQRASLGRILVMNGDDLSKPWYNCTINEVVGYQVGSRSAGPLSFVLKIRDRHSGGAFLNLTVACSCVMERTSMLQFLSRSGGLEQIPAAIVSDSSRDLSSVKTYLMNAANRHSPQHQASSSSRRPVATPNTVFDLIDTHVRDGGYNDEDDEDQDPDQQQQLMYSNFLASQHHHQQQQQQQQQQGGAPQLQLPSHLIQHKFNRRKGSTSSSSHESSNSGTTGTSSSDIIQGEYTSKQQSSSDKNDFLGAGAPPHVSRTAPSSPNKPKYFTLGRLSTEHASPHPNVVPESYDLATFTTDQPTACQLCGTPNKSECALCKATGLFHPEFLSARAAEREIAASVTAMKKRLADEQQQDNQQHSSPSPSSSPTNNNNNNNNKNTAGMTTSILHFMPPMQVVPRQDVAVAFKHFVDASKKSSDVPQFAKYKQDTEKLTHAVLERYEEECKILAEEADLHLFAASVEGFGPREVKSYASTISDQQQINHQHFDPHQKFATNNNLNTSNHSASFENLVLSGQASGTQTPNNSNNNRTTRQQQQAGRTSFYNPNKSNLFDMVNAVVAKK